MHDQNGHTIGLAALFDIHVMPVANIQNPLIERVERRVQKFNCALLA
jgi:hypothetical protein